ncbi:MAG: fructose-6-phosphate aldolase [Erysipelotrichaceae bacterium]|nr:fructose-6-phosphate aldolase [Erysipelotrichaceae bacterium]
MELYLDTADVNAIREINGILKLDGVTTNPTILTREKADYHETIKAISSLLNDDQKLFMQVISTDYEGILKEARQISGLRKNMYVKIPVTPDGLKAMKVLSKEGIGILATAIYTAPQGFLAARNGAQYLAPYVNRMENYLDGIEETLLLERMLKENRMETKVIAASFKNVNQVKKLMAGGIDAVTVPVDVCRNLFLHEGTDKAVDEFTANWEKRFNEKQLHF